VFEGCETYCIHELLFLASNIRLFLR
jgi:hypothetical protein